MKIDIIKINQDGNVFYVGKILARDLINIATTKVRGSLSSEKFNTYLEEIDSIIRDEINEGNIWYLKDSIEDVNIQRKKSKERLQEIGNYINRANSIFPNSIIINLSMREAPIEDKDIDINQLIQITDNSLYFDETKVVANIIDGQHRLGGFEYANNIYLDKYELIVTIMIGLEPAQQAELFATINGKQKAVNKSVLYDLSSMTENEYSMSVTAHLITSWFNVNEKSPLRNKIKMLGEGEGTISQAAMIEAIVPLIKEKNISFNDAEEINKVLPVLNEEFKKQDSKIIIKFLYDYFKCFKEVFPYEWEYNVRQNDIKKYILNKTTGISGILMAFSNVYSYQNYINDFSYNTLVILIEKLVGKIDFTSEIYKGGSKDIQKKLANDISKILFKTDDLYKYRYQMIQKLREKAL